MHRTAPVRLTCLLLCLFALGACERRAHLVEQHLLAFGTLIQVTLITGDLSEAQTTLDEIEKRLHRWHRQWHAWEDSDLTRFNRALAAGENPEIPDSLRDLIELSQAFNRSSNGLFDPALGKLIEARGFHGGEPAPARANALIADLPAMSDLEITGNRARSRHPDLQLDFGGIAKGYALARLRDYLGHRGVEHYVINAGGDLITAGNRFGKPWRIGIQNPFAPGAIAGVELKGRHSLFTSGNYRRFYQRGAKRAHHVIDPRSGESATGPSSATILIDDPVRADVAATTLMIADPWQRSALAQTLQVDKFLLVSENRQIIVSSGWLEKVQIFVQWDTKITN